MDNDVSHLLTISQRTDTYLKSDYEDAYVLADNHNVFLQREAIKKHPAGDVKRCSFRIIGTGRKVVQRITILRIVTNPVMNKPRSCLIVSMEITTE